MKRIIPVVIILLLALTTFAAAQIITKPGWVNTGIFPPAGKAEKDITTGGRLKDTLHTNSIHGLAVSPDGRVWIQNYYAYARDSILVTNYRFYTGDTTKGTKDSLRSRYVTVRRLYCYNPDGTPAPFSPILTAKGIGAKIDTMGGESVASTTGPFQYWTGNSGAGLRADQDGNILASYWSYLYRINYRTGVGMGKMDAGIQSGTQKTIVAVGVDKDGDIFSNAVIPPAPVKIFDKNFNFIGNAVDTGKGYSRTVMVSADGNDVYYCGYSLNAVYRYHSDNGVLGPYAKCDTILKGMVVESINWQPKTGYLWVSGGSYSGMPNGWYDKSVVQKWSPDVWYAYDPVSKAIKDSIVWEFGVAKSPDERPRAIAFTPSGDTVYVGVFGSSNAPGVRRYIYSQTGVYVAPETGVIPTGYTLSQNYPNPFNPSTQIRFTLTQTGMTSLKVYDLMGREVATLVDESLNPGAYSVKFDASHLSSGTYMYVLTSGSVRLTNKMMLLK
jgi:hypothetical protein